jgi:RNA recognition motif-containing protein
VPKQKKSALQLTPEQQKAVDRWIEQIRTDPEQQQLAIRLLQEVQAQKRREGPPPEVVQETEAIWKEIESFLKTKDESGKRIGSIKWGIYAFYDYFGEPLYVGRTKERLGTRTRRHLTNQRTDAVAMSVLDPVEVAEVELWPFDLKDKSEDEISRILTSAEYTVKKKVIDASKLKFVLNEKDIPTADEIELPKSYRKRIVPLPIYEVRQHPDIRIAQRAATIADLAKIIVERKVQKGLRRTLLFQAVRLQSLAKERLDQITGPIEVEGSDEETGDDS